MKKILSFCLHGQENCCRFFPVDTSRNIGHSHHVGKSRPNGQSHPVGQSRPDGQSQPIGHSALAAVNQPLQLVGLKQKKCKNVEVDS